MRYLSVCSGIEAASVAAPEGWHAAAYAEIEPFPSAVLAHRFPTVPNLGDFTKIEAHHVGAIDLLVGGTPCQSFSVAGKRAGLDDPRGNLTLEFLALARRLRPRYIVWENVPGVLSIDGGRTIRQFLDTLADLGYIADIDIVDAQFCGIPQRRRRVFVCAQHRSDILKSKTNSSALTIAKCWLEILAGISAGQRTASGSAPTSSGLAWDCADGARQRMKLFGLLTESDALTMWLESLVEAFQRSVPAQKLSTSDAGASDAGSLVDGPLMDLTTDLPCSLTGESLKSILAESLAVMKSCITLTTTRTTTKAETYICSQAVLTISALIAVLEPSSPNWSAAASSSLTVLQEFTNYARSASRELFVDMERLPEWDAFVRQAGYFIEFARHSGGDWQRAAAVLFEPESLRRNPAESRRTRQDAASALGASSGGADDNDAESETLIANPTAFALRGRKTGAVPEIYDDGDTVGALRAASGGSSRDYVSFDWQGSGNQGDLGASLPGCGALGTTKTPAVFDAVQMTSAVNRSRVEPGAPAGTLSKNSDMHAIAGGVRRLMPVETERLQGFPDGWTDVPYRGKPAADGPRYKAIGNSMAVPVMRWIFNRLDFVDRLQQPPAPPPR